MPEMLRISLLQPLAALHVIEGGTSGGWQNGNAAVVTDALPDSADLKSKIAGAGSPAELDQRKKELAQLCETVNSLVEKLDRLCEETLAHSHGDIARLAVEIARKVVMVEIEKGHYDIQAIIREALKRAPAHQDLVVRLHPQDVTLCQRLQQENPDSPLARLKLVADGGIARANCLVETPKGVVRSFVEDGLEHIREALEKAQ